MDGEFRYLGKATTAPSKDLDTFSAPAHVTEVSFTSEELTSFCPVTGQPDFYRVEIHYQPDQLCVESKSLKLYLWSFREDTAFAEQLASTIATDLYSALQPFSCKVTLAQSVRGGLSLRAVAERKRDRA